MFGWQNKCGKFKSEFLPYLYCNDWVKLLKKKKKETFIN